MLDSATGCAVQTTLPAGVGYTTLELKTNFVRAITRDTGRILCAEVVHRGGTIATAEGCAPRPPASCSRTGPAPA